MPHLNLSRKKALILGAAGLLVLIAVGGGAYLLLSGRDELQYKTQAALRKALPVTAAAELHKRGVDLGSPLKCDDLPGWTKKKMRVSCTGTTSDKKPVKVLGSGEEETHKAYYTILVDGRPVVQNASCLGADCVRKEG
ncbi:hypothetical protein E1293_13625 [Actinomadura darangshiensis]|uniref:DUF4333 domain-containing protein n=1 Tax=Actinomadura darangshiensis TaxID=705336 RepID=A0A4R5BEP0_9ACTN|nr:hypothetical protein [Actinomadura darangshiensis]TDD84075.1 hypothetical protein E1293_13625 [Actinomadura darangshiensis]